LGTAQRYGSARFTLTEKRTSLAVKSSLGNPGWLRLYRHFRAGWPNSMNRLSYLPIIVASALGRREHRYEFAKCPTGPDNEKQALTSTWRVIPNEEFLAKCITSIGLPNLHLGRWIIVGHPLADILGKLEVIMFRLNSGHFRRDGDSFCEERARVFDPMPQVVLIPIPGSRTVSHPDNVE
jgi:hypothetical protein